MKPIRQERNLLFYIYVVGSSSVLEINHKFCTIISKKRKEIQIQIFKKQLGRWGLEFFGVLCSCSFFISLFQVNFLPFKSFDLY